MKYPSKEGMFFFVGMVMDKIRTTDIKEMKKRGEKISMITAYDFTTAEIVDEAGVDIVLVGDSLGNVIQGRGNTLSVTVDDMVYHASIVSRGVKRAHVSCDMPFMSYQVSTEDALRNAGRLVKEGNAESVKLEIDFAYIDTIKAITAAGIPVISHIGLRPQCIHAMGGYKIQGKTDIEAKRLLELAKMSQEAGAFLIVLEGIPSSLASVITQSLDIPTVGIGAGAKCDGQVLVFNDMVGLSKGPLPKFVKRFSKGREIFFQATCEYIEEVKKGRFPSSDNVYE